MKKRPLALGLTASLLCLSFAGCTGSADTGAAASAQQTAAPEIALSSAVESAVEATPETVITLNGAEATIEGDGAEVTDATVTITDAGTYRITGTLSGRLLVDAGKKDEVVLLLDGADITAEDGAALAVQKAGLVTVSPVKGTENSLTDGTDYTFPEGEDEPDGALYSKADLVLDGEGSLTVTGSFDKAIHGKDTVTVENGTYTLRSVGDGLKGKDAVSILGGNITIESGSDGIQSNNDSDPDMGNVNIAGGSVVVTAAGDGIQAVTLLEISGGNVVVNAAEDGVKSDKDISIAGGYVTIEAAEDGVQADGNADISDGTLNIITGGGSANAPEHRDEFAFPGWEDTTTEETTASTKGIKAGTDLTVSGGAITVDSMDDALHCGGTLTVSDQAEIAAAAGDDGLHADDHLVISGGTINVTKCYEGLEAVFIDISGGEISLVCSDDGMNASGEEIFGGPGMQQAETLETATTYLHISGGEIHVDASGDGLDSNGAFFVEGGEVYVSGPESSMNGALDYSTTGQITGGTVVAAGVSGMAQNFDSSSTQVSILATLSGTVAGGETVTLTDESGKVLLETTMQKSYQTIVVSTPELQVGKTYTLTCGDETMDIEVTDTITTTGGFGFGGFGGGPGGFPGFPGGPGGPPNFG